MTSDGAKTSSVVDDSGWEKIKEEITCSVCYELFTDPRTLPCLHTFCKLCIEKGIKTRLADVPVGFFECFLCRAQVPLPAKGTDGITANFSVKRLIEIYNKRSKLATATAPKFCVCTDGEFATMWCVECNCPICLDCSAYHKRTKRFSKHRVISMKEYTSNPKCAIEVSLNPGICTAHPTTGDIASENIMKSKVFIGVDLCHSMKL